MEVNCYKILLANLLLEIENLHESVQHMSSFQSYLLPIL